MTAGCHSAAAFSMRSQRSCGGNPPFAARISNGALQLSGSALPLLRQIACASLVHCASAAPVAWRASSSAQRSATSLIEGDQAARKAGQSWRRDAAASQIERNASATAWPW